MIPWYWRVIPWYLAMIAAAVLSVTAWSVGYQASQAQWTRAVERSVADVLACQAQVEAYQAELRRPILEAHAPAPVAAERRFLPRPRPVTPVFGRQ